MKTLRLLAFALFISSASFAQKVETKQAPIIPVPLKDSKLKFEKDTHDFGNIPQGTPATYEFSFVNNSNKDVLIKNVGTSCGCTAPSYTKTAIKPGEKGVITATFNAAAAGPFNKTLTVFTSEEGVNPKGIVIKGNVNVATPAAVTTPSK
jgi:hypothetical protein